MTLNIGEQLDSSSKLNVLFCQVRFVTQWFNSPCDPQARYTVFLVGLLMPKVQIDVLGTLRHLRNVP